MKNLAAAFILASFALINVACAQEPSPSESHLFSESTNAQQSLQAPIIAQRCCKVCTTGKACGNSCISRSKECHQPPGCACDGRSELKNLKEEVSNNDGAI